MILYLHQISDCERPNLAAFGQFLLQIIMERDPRAMGVAWVQSFRIQKCLLGIFTFSEVYGFHFKSHKP